MYPDFDDYYEPSEFEQQVEEFKDSLKRSVKQETQELIERLRKENEELRSVRDNWEEVKRSYEKKQRELQNEIYTCKQNASRMRLDQLFEECGMNVILYSPYSYSVYNPKCDKCDDDRYIHYKSPSGKDNKEECECAKSFRKYKPSAEYLCEFRVNKYGSDRKQYPLMMWFKKYRDYRDDYDGYTYDSNSLARFIYNGEDFEEVRKEHNTSVYFREEEKCQEYCDYLSKLNGVTEDMTEHKRRVALMK